MRFLEKWLNFEMFFYLVNRSDFTLCLGFRIPVIILKIKTLNIKKLFFISNVSFSSSRIATKKYRSLSKIANVIYEKCNIECICEISIMYLLMNF